MFPLLTSRRLVCYAVNQPKIKTPKTETMKKIFIWPFLLIFYCKPVSSQPNTYIDEFYSISNSCYEFEIIKNLWGRLLQYESISDPIVITEYDNSDFVDIGRYPIMSGQTLRKWIKIKGIELNPKTESIIIFFKGYNIDTIEIENDSLILDRFNYNRVEYVPKTCFLDGLAKLVLLEKKHSQKRSARSNYIDGVNYSEKEYNAIKVRTVFIGMSEKAMKVAIDFDGSPTPLVEYQGKIMKVYNCVNTSLRFNFIYCADGKVYRIVPKKGIVRQQR